MKYILLISIILNVTGVVAQSPTIDSLKQIVALQKHDTVELNALLNLSNEFLRRDLSLAKQYSSELIKLANNPTEVKWLSAAYNYLITIYQQTGKPDSSRYFLARSEAITRQNASNGKIKYNFNQAAGLFYKNSGEYNQALSYFGRAVENRKGCLGESHSDHVVRETEECRTNRLFPQCCARQTHPNVYPTLHFIL